MSVSARKVAPLEEGSVALAHTAMPTASPVTEGTLVIWLLLLIVSPVMVRYWRPVVLMNPSVGLPPTSTIELTIIWRCLVFPYQMHPSYDAVQCASGGISLASSMPPSEGLVYRVTPSD